MAGIAARVVKAGPQPEFAADFSIDGHSHIQSGATVPLPLVWNRMGDIRLSRSVIDTLAPVAIKGGQIQRKKTEEIAGELASELAAAYKGSKLLKDKPYHDGMSDQQRADELIGNQTHIFSPAIIMPMDMDYAHIAGFPPSSATIYHEGEFKIIKPEMEAARPEDKPNDVVFIDGNYYRITPKQNESTVDGVYCYDRQNADAPEEKGILVDVTHERPNHEWVFQCYKKQHKNTVASIKKNPWLLIPMFHYDPRRWCKQSGTEVEADNWTTGPWDFPFKYIATLRNAGIFIGFKMYPPLGYKPLDPRLPNLDKFYAKCAEEGIPILAHCSPGGMTTHEAKFYHALDKADLTKLPTRIVSCTYDPCEPLGYFFDNYVHPRNWRPVLMKYPKLKLCLAHFGGDEWKKIGIASDWVEEITNLCDPRIVQGRDSSGYEICFENVYTDMSCYNLYDSSLKKNMQELFREMRSSRRYRHLQDKVMFGVDWYLSIITEAPEYKEYVESFFDTMGEIDNWQWYRSALVNPATFYGLDNNDIVNNMHAALMSENKAAKEDAKKKLHDNYLRISSIQNQVQTMRKELAKTRPEAQG